MAAWLCAGRLSPTPAVAAPSPRVARRTTKSSAPSSRDPSPPPARSWVDGNAQAAGAGERVLEQQSSR